MTAHVLIAIAFAAGLSDPTGCREFEVARPAATGETVEAARYGVVPEAADVGPGLQRAFDACVGRTGAVLRLKKGATYRIRTAVRMTNLVDFTFDGGGAKLVQDRAIVADMPPLWTVKDCRRVVIRDFSADWDWATRPLASFGRLENVKGDAFDFRFLDYARFPWRENLRVAEISEVDPVTRSPGVDGKAVMHFEFYLGKYAPRTEWRGDAVLHVSGGGTDWNRSRLHFLREGRTYRMFHNYYEGGSFFLGLDSRDVTFEDIRLFSTLGKNFHFAAMRNWQLVRVACRPPEGDPRRMVSSTADGYGHERCFGNFKMVDCVFAAGNDDFLNFQDPSVFCVKTASNAVETVNYRGGVPRCGDRVSVRGPRLEDLGCEATVIAATRLPNGRRATGPWGGVALETWRLALDRAIPVLTNGEATVLFERKWNSGNVIVRGCRFEGVEGSGRFQSSNVTVEDCVFRDVMSCPMRIWAEYTGNVWCEGHGVTNLVVRNCRFERCAHGRRIDAKRPWANVAVGSGTPFGPGRGAFRDILLENNVFVDPAGVAVRAEGVEGLVLRGNRVERNGRTEPDFGAFVEHVGSRARGVAKTIFQASCPWMPEVDVRSDGVMVYGANDRPGLPFAERLRGWRDRGYVPLFMTGVAWGGYRDYFDGSWDGIRHYDSEAQVRSDGKRIEHGPFTPYIAPTEPFARYLCERQVKPAIDAGAEAIYLEEPEYWAGAGWCEAFRRAWKEAYGEEWRPPNESVATAWRANRLKQDLYRKTIETVLAFAKDYSRRRGREVGCYVATHSTLNYAMWSCVSPEAALALVPQVDGYIAQVWSDTAISPVYWRGELGSHPFEVAYLEYGSVKAMVAPTGRRVWFLTDPAADGRRGWEDFKSRYEATYAAQLLHTDVADYQVLPWPNRIYTGTYKVPGKDKEERIPPAYATQIQVMINALGDMPLARDGATGATGATGVGVAISDTLMVQRTSVRGVHVDGRLSDHYGLTLPLVKRGVPVTSVYLENAGHPKAFDGLKVLCLSYAAMKPPTEESNERIAAWVKAGGWLVWCGAEDDPYQSVPEWWNSDGRNYATPSQHLFDRLGLGRDPSSGVHRCGSGGVTVIRGNPKLFLKDGAGDGADYFAAVAAAYRTVAGADLKATNRFEARRGPYAVFSVMDRTGDETPLTATGRFIDLFDPELPIVTSKTVVPGQQALLYDLDRLPEGPEARVLCGASRVSDERRDGRSYAFVAKGPKGTPNVSRILLPAAPKTVLADGAAVKPSDADWDVGSKTLRLRFTNSDVGVKVEVRW